MVFIKVATQSLSVIPPYPTPPHPDPPHPTPPTASGTDASALVVCPSVWWQQVGVGVSVGVGVGVGVGASATSIRGILLIFEPS